MSIDDRSKCGQTDLTVQACSNVETVDAGDENTSPDSPVQDAPLPRSIQRPRRAKADRGLPPDEELAKLAQAYLERQRQHWPALAEAGLLPQSSDQVIHRMVADFKERHRTGKVDVATVRPFLKFAVKLGGNYSRYSCDKSNPLSALDQMVNCLNRARQEDIFVPWAYIFCDYSVSGLDTSRQGYSSYKSVLVDPHHLISTTYIDDFTRASRDEVEWWKLAALSKRHNKRMIGASDGFDLSNPNSELLITIFGLVSRLFIKSLREKVRRGMSAANRGTCLGKPSLGFTRRVHRDQNGNIEFRPDGRPRHEVCIDPETREFRLLLYTLLLDRNWSINRITKEFNRLRVDGWDGWTASTIRKLLWSPTSIGVFIWNGQRQEYDPDECKWVSVKNPRSEWQIYHDRALALVSLEVWKAARRKLAAARRANPLTGRRPSRNQISATTLFSGTLVCGDCGEEIKLTRSAEKYKQMGCIHGIASSHGCRLSASKSVRVIEECLLGYLRDHLLSDSAAEELVAKANAFLEQEALKPQVAIAPLRAEARKLDTKIKKLVLRIEAEPQEELCVGYDRRVKELQKDLNGLNAQIRDAETRNHKHIRPLSREQVMAYLADFRTTFNEEIPVAAEAIRTLTGPIQIRQQLIPGRNKGARWIATFSPDLLRMLRYVANDDARRSLPDFGDEVPTPTVEVVIDKVPRYEQRAAEFKRLRDNGASVQSIAFANGMTRKCAKEIIDFADTGKRPHWRAGKRTGKGSPKTAKYKEIFEEVVRLRDLEKMSFAKIAKRLTVSEGTVKRAYDYARPEAVRRAVDRGERPQRGRFSHLGGEKVQLIRKMVREGRTPAEIIDKVGCGKSTVDRVSKQLREEVDGAQAA